ncbi:MAG: hypothetical protein ABUJ98_15655, partial [Hyphomicrobium sp.]
QMANWYSDIFGADGSADSAIASPKTIAARGKQGDELLVKRATITVLDSAAADVCWMFSMGSGDRLYELRYGYDGGWSASSSSELGLYTFAETHDGAVLDVDLFGASIDLSTAAVDITTETFSAGALGGEDRGKQMWQLLEIGATQSYTVDPGVRYDLCMTLSGNDDATSSTLVVYALYTAGG